MARIGLALGGLDARPLGDLLRFALIAEECGYELLSVPEAWGRDAVAVVGYLAAKTERIRLSTGIVNVFSRSPALLAMAAATLDEASGGRFTLGLGVSGRAVIEGFHGVPFRRPLRRLRETTELVRTLLRREHAGYAGELVQLAPRFILRVPPTVGEVRIYHACLGQAAIEQCAAIADGWMPFFASAETLRRDLPMLTGALNRAGRSRFLFTVAPVVGAVVDDDIGQARAALRRHLAFYVGGMGRYYGDALARRGYGDVVERVRDAWTAGKRQAAADAVPDPLIDEVSLCGPAARARERLSALRAAGADVPIVYVPHDAPAESVERTIRGLA